MPQLVKGGKYVFGWSPVGQGGCIRIPPEALVEYGFLPDEHVFILTASVSSGGFIITRKPVILGSGMASIITSIPRLAEYSIAEGSVIRSGKRNVCRTTIDKDGRFVLPMQSLACYGISEGSRLLATRGSYVGLSMLMKGPIIEEAVNHPEIGIFTA
jgi:hypothetical protein